MHTYDSRHARDSSKAVSQPIHAWLSLVVDQSSLLTDQRQMGTAADVFRTLNCDVRDEKSRYFAWPRHALKITTRPMLFPTRGAIALRRRTILRSSHDPDYDGEFARLLEQLLTAGKCSGARPVARASWRLGGSGLYSIAGVSSTLQVGLIHKNSENSRTFTSKPRICSLDCVSLPRSRFSIEMKENHVES